MNKDDRKVNPECPCTSSGCPRHGVCKECREYHHAQGQKTCCERKKGEK